MNWSMNREVERGAREDAERENQHRASEKGERDIARSHGNGDGGAGRGLAHVHVDDDAQVVVRAEHAVEEADHGEPVESASAVDGRAEDVELAEESGRRRDASERQEEERE